MALERWVQTITSLPGKFIRPTFYQAESQAVVGAAEANYRMLVVYDNDNHGLKPGVYVQTNLTEEGAVALPHVRRMIVQQVSLVLMGRQTKFSTDNNTSLDNVIIDYSNAIEMHFAAKSTSGDIVFRVIRPESISRLREIVRGMSPNDYSLTPLAHFRIFLERIRQGKFWR